MVYRLIARNTIEDKVAALARRKAALFSGVMDDGDCSPAAYRRGYPRTARPSGPGSRRSRHCEASSPAAAGGENRRRWTAPRCPSGVLGAARFHCRIPAHRPQTPRIAKRGRGSTRPLICGLSCPAAGLPPDSGRRGPQFESLGRPDCFAVGLRGMPGAAEGSGFRLGELCSAAEGVGRPRCAGLASGELIAHGPHTLERPTAHASAPCRELIARRLRPAVTRQAAHKDSGACPPVHAPTCRLREPEAATGRWTGGGGGDQLP